MPPELLQTILALNAQGATIVVQGGWPTEVPGHFQQKERGEKLKSMVTNGLSNDNILHAADSVLPPLAAKGVLKESMTASSLRFIRRSHSAGFHYFIVNRSDKPFDGVLPLAVPFQSAAILDPWDATEIKVAQAKDGGISLQLEPGQSVIIRTFTGRKIEGKPWTAVSSNPQVTAIDGPWQIQFLEGGPTLPAPAENLKTGSWASLPDAANFSGTARYTTAFDLAALPAACRLDLGKVAETARVSLNGQPLGISWCAPHVIDITEAVKPGRNLLEIEVTNLAANRIADLDRRKVPWKQFHEINFVNIDYKLFDASFWPALDSGLLGPVSLLVP